MNTQSMIIALNSIILFNTAHPGLGISSLRKKIVNICTSVGKKSLAILGGIALAFLSAISLKGAQLTSKAQILKRAWDSSRAMQGSQIPPHTIGPVRDPAQDELRARAAARKSQMLRSGARSAAAAALSSVRLGTRPPKFSFETSDQPKPEEQQPDTNDNQELALKIAKLCHQEQFKQVLHDIRGGKFSLNYLPHQLRGTEDNPNILERIPKWVINMIVQFIHQDDLYHQRSFYVPRHRSEPELLLGRPAPDGAGHSSSSTINFIDGDPHRLEMAWCPPQNRGKNPLIGNMYSMDVITINPTPCVPKIDTQVPISLEVFGSLPISYIQRLKRSQFFSTTHPLILPLIQQLNFTDRYNSRCIMWRKDNSSYDEGCTRNYRVSNCLGWKRVDPSIKKEDLYSYGLQRNLLNGRVVWVLTQGNYVGIYEKEQRWYDEECAVRHPAFESVKQDHSGTTFHLGGVIEEEAPVQSVALPYTPVYLQDADGKELKGCIGCPPDDATAHLRSPHKYPKSIDAVALGLNPTYTNTRLSLYRQRGDNLRDYPPELLLHQNPLITPKRKDRLYPDEPKMPRPSLTAFGEIQVGLNMAKRAARQAVGIEQPELEE